MVQGVDTLEDHCYTKDVCTDSLAAYLVNSVQLKNTHEQEMQEFDKQHHREIM